MSITFDKRAFTEEELVLVEKIYELRDKLTENWLENSRKLGFKAKKKCWCGKSIKDEEIACSEECKQYVR